MDRKVVDHHNLGYTMGHGLRLFHWKSQSDLVELARILICTNETEDSGIDAWYVNLTGRRGKPAKETNIKSIKTHLSMLQDTPG